MSQQQDNNPYANRANVRGDPRNRPPQSQPPNNAWQQPPPPQAPPQYVPGPPPQRMVYYTPYPNPYAPQQQQRPAGLWQPAPPTYTPGGTYYPPPQQPPQQVKPPAPAPKRHIPVITDKYGNVIDLSAPSTKSKSTSAAPSTAPATTAPGSGGVQTSTPAATTSTSTTSTTSKQAPVISSEDAGSKLRQAALERIAQMDAQKKAQAATTTTVEQPLKTESYAEKLKKQQEVTTNDDKTEREVEEKAKREAEDKAKREAEEKAKKEAEEKARLLAEEKAKKEAEEKSRLEAEDKAKRETEEKAKKEAEEQAKHEAEEMAKREAEEQTKRQAEEQAKIEAEEKAKQARGAVQEEPPKRPSFLQKLQAKKEAAGLTRGGSLSALASKLDAQQQGETPPPPSLTPRTGTLRPLSMSASKPSIVSENIQPVLSSPSANGTSKRRVYSKQELLRFKEMDVCCCRPIDLPDMTIERVEVGGGGAGGGGGGGGGGRARRESWQRGAAPPRDSQRHLNAPQAQQEPKQQQQWARGVAPPPAPPQGQQGGGTRGRGAGSRGGGPPLLDGPVAPLVKSENRWRPKKNANALVVAEKQVKAILNKMTKEKFDKLSTQMCEIPILSYDMLTMMIHNVYEKAIDEPTFGDMYADLCTKLSLTAKQGTSFIKIIPSDEEPPTDGEATTGESSSHKVYRWSNDVSTTDAEIVGPYGSPEECTEVALSGEDLEPAERGDMELELHSLVISNGNFIKIMQHKDEVNVYYVVYFPVAEHQDCGQQLSKIFLSERECMSDAVKQNSFKRSLLNKCQDEFDKQDIYVDWKAEKKAYEETKSSLTEAERGEKEAELNFRRMKMKKQMLGNIKFIGQLYKKSLLKEKIMRYCIGSLLKLEVIDDSAKYPEYKDSGDMDLDEEDHEAACSMFATIGKTIDRPQARTFMSVCFTKMEKLSNDKALSSRARFMYKDLIDLRANNWEPRRETEKAKTIEEIRKDFEREERMQEQQSRQMGGYGGGGNRGGDRRGYGDRRDDHRDGRRDFGGGNRNRQPRPPVQTDEEGFTVIGNRGGGGSGRPTTTPVRIATRPSTSNPVAPPKPPSPEPVKNDGPAPLSSEKLDRRIATIRSEYMQDPSNVEDMLLSFDELSGTPDAGMTLVSRNGDRIFDCKDAEREAITEMLVLLVENDKLSKDAVRNGLADAVEFIDSFVIDSPMAYEYLADVLSAMLKVEALDIIWLCEQVEKLKLDPDKAKVVRKTMEAMKEKYGVEAVRSAFSGADESLKLTALLGADKWNDMANEIMS